MAFDKRQTIDAFLMAAASKQPAPGGGSVTALVGALSAAMGEMVLNYSVGKKDLAAQEIRLREALAEFTRARGIFCRSRPATRISPSLGSSSLIRSFIAVDLPEPEWPTRKTNSPGKTSKDTPSSATSVAL